MSAVIFICGNLFLQIAGKIAKIRTHKNLGHTVCSLLSSKIIKKSTYLSPGCTASTKSLCEKSMIVCGVWPGGISSKENKKIQNKIQRNVLHPSRQTGHKIHMKIIQTIGNLEIPAAWWFVCLCTAICCESTPYCDLCCSYGTGQAQKCDHDRFLQSLKRGRHNIGRMLKPKKNFITFNERRT